MINIMIFRADLVEANLNRELRLRLFCFLGLPGLTLFSSLAWLFVDWMKILQFVFRERRRFMFNI